jgi:hypothetical protein
VITQIADDYRFSSPEMQICSLAVRVADLADRFRFAVSHWDDDGLGPAASICVELESGRTTILVEHAHAIKHLGAKGPIVFVEARDLAKIGVASFVDEVLDAFQLSREDADWIAPDENMARAIDLLRRSDETDRRPERRE